MLGASRKIAETVACQTVVTESFRFKFVTCRNQILLVRCPIKMRVDGVNLSVKNTRFIAAERLKADAQNAVGVCAFCPQTLITGLKNELAVDNLGQRNLSCEKLRFLEIIRVIRIGNKIRVAEICNRFAPFVAS